MDEVELADGRRSTREVVEHRGAVAVLAWDGSHLTMVRQWRQPATSALLEIPAGTLDPGEEPLATARRELWEETGLVADSWERGPSFFTAPGFCTERLSIFLAEGVRPGELPGASAPDDETIQVSRLTLDEALAAVDRGAIADAKSLVGILWLERRLRG